MSAAYYNEIDPYCAQWLRNLIVAGHIAAGDVDERSIEDVRPNDLRGYTQCHFFAGIGVWSSALRLAGWPDDRPVWTGSCPCQPFSAAGKGVGFADERHLWPAWHWLICECRPATVFGEQVASADGLGWLDLVHADLEEARYACGSVDLCAAGVGAPHIRQRLWFVAHADGMRRAGIRRRGKDRAPEHRKVGGLADVHRDGCEPWGPGRSPLGHRPAAEPNRSSGRLDNAERDRWMSRGSSDSRDDGIITSTTGEIRELADAESAGRREVGENDLRSGERSGSEGMEQRTRDVRFLGRDEPAGPTNGFWRDADWLLCRDGKWRPVEPGTFPLAHGAASRVGRLRAYGNAIVREAAGAFIRASMIEEQIAGAAA